MMRDPGVRLVGKIIHRVAAGQTPTVAEVAKDFQVSRSTAFAVAGKLENAELVVRDVKGRMSAGPGVKSLIYGRLGIGPLSGPAEAIVAWLYDRTGGRVELRAATGEVVLSIGESASAGLRATTADIRDVSGEKVAYLVLIPCELDTPASELALASLNSAAATLTHYLAVGNDQ